MSKNTQYTFSPSDYALYTSVIGTALPATVGPGNPGTGWYDCGYLSDAGITEAHNTNETKIYDLVGKLLRVIRNQEERPFTFECTQYDAVVLGLKYPGTTVTSSGGTAEVQTVTITGTPTGGTFSLTLPNYGTASALAYNITTTALATALSTAFGITVTVSGTPGTSYVVTFPVSVGNVPQMSATNAFTGGTTPTIAVATTTPGVNGTNTRLVGSGTGRNLRQFCIDLFDGAVSKRILIGNGEAVWTGNVTDSGSAIEISQFTLNPFPDPNNNQNYYTIIDNAPSSTLTFA